MCIDRVLEKYAAKYAVANGENIGNFICDRWVSVFL